MVTVSPTSFVIHHLECSRTKVFADIRPRQLEHSVEKPPNREPAVKELILSLVTCEGAYNCSHGPTLHLDSCRHRITVDGAVMNCQWRGPRVRDIL
jgi:hypothetical protein